MRFITSGHCLKLYFLVCLFANKQTRALATVEHMMAKWVARGKNLMEKRREWRKTGDFARFLLLLVLEKPQLKRWTPGVAPHTSFCIISLLWCLEHLLLLFIEDNLRVQHGAEWFLPRGFATPALKYFLSCAQTHGKCLWRDSGIVMQFSASQCACHCWCCISFQKNKGQVPPHGSQTGTGLECGWPKQHLRLLTRPCVVYRLQDRSKQMYF